MHKHSQLTPQSATHFEFTSAFSKWLRWLAGSPATQTSLPLVRILKLFMVVCVLLGSYLLVTAQVDNGGTTTPTVSEVSIDEQLDLYSGQLRLSVPLLHTNGRGSSYTDIALSIQSEQIVGSGIYAWGFPYPEESYMFSDLYQNPSFNSPRFHREYYSQLYRFGSGYGPGVLYAEWSSFGTPMDQLGNKISNITNWRRPAQLTFMDSKGRAYILRDEQLIQQFRIMKEMFGTGQGFYLAGLGYLYHNLTQPGQVYRSTDDGGIKFTADSTLSVPIADGIPDRDNKVALLRVPLLPSGYLDFRDGTRMRISNGYVSWVRDRNGNYTTYDYQNIPASNATLTAYEPSLRRVTAMHDSLGRTITIQYGTTGSAPDTISYEGIDRTPRTIKVQKNLLANCLQTGDTSKALNELYRPAQHRQLQGLNTAIKHNPEVVSWVEFGNGKRVTFDYNSYGEVATVYKPTGAKTKYLFGSGHPLASDTDQGYELNKNFEAPGFKLYERWHYLRRLRKIDNYLDDTTLLNSVRMVVPAIQVDATMTEVNTLGNTGQLLGKQKHYFKGSYFWGAYVGVATENQLLNHWYDGLESKVETYNIVNGNAVLASTTENTWTHGEFNITAGVGDYAFWSGNRDILFPRDRARLTSKKVTLNDINQTSEITYDYDKYLNVTDTREYDFGTSGTGALLRRTHTDYLTVNPVTGTNYIHAWGQLLSLPQHRYVYQGTSNTPFSVQDFEYDNYASDQNHAGLLVRPGIVNLCVQLDASGNCQEINQTAVVERGNLTSSTVYKDASNSTGPIPTYTEYDVAGNRILSKDPLGNETTYEYDDAYTDGINHNSFAISTRVKTPIPDPGGTTGAAGSLVTDTSYDYATGAIRSTRDSKGQTVAYSYTTPEGIIDPSDRLRLVTRPDGGWTSYEYGDDPGNIYLHSRSVLKASPQQIVESYQYYDNLSRPTRTYSTAHNGATSWIAKETKHNSLSQVIEVSNLGNADAPPAAVPATAKTKTTYDGLGRTVSIETPDTAKTTTAYLGNKQLVTDQAGKSRRLKKDALGRLVEVVEYARTLANPNVVEDPDANDFVTTYEYDAGDRLTKVIQGGQTRNFQYDSLGRMTSVSSPEGGVINYEYDNNGNLHKRTDARFVEVTYTYDHLNRLTRREYSIAAGHSTPANYVSTPAVDLYYDGKGMPIGVPTPQFAKGSLSAIKSAAGETIYTDFDLMGRVTAQRQVLDPQSTNARYYSMEYGYNLLGNMTFQKYPSGKIVSVDYDNDGRVAGIRNGTQYYAGGDALSPNRITYTAEGAITALRFGNGLWEHSVFNSRQQPVEVGLGSTNTDSTLYKSEYAYGTLNPQTNTLDATKNNGSIYSQTLTLSNGAKLVDYYSYDSLNRLTKGREVRDSDNLETWKQTYIYDRFGNRTIDATAASTSPELIGPNPAISPLNNRISTSGYGYDASGNLTAGPGTSVGLSYDYDSENKQVAYRAGSAVTYTYTYDGLGHRVKRSGVENLQASNTDFVYNINGQVVAEYADVPTPVNAGISYLTVDHLGSTRVTTGRNGQVLSRHDYLPFGDEIGSASGGTDRGTVPGYYAAPNTPYKYAGKEFDPESQLTYFGARYYSATLGRFSSPDSPFADQYIQNPQSWNLYTYTRNNPIRVSDSNGRVAVWDILDVIAFFYDTYQFVSHPSWQNAAWLAVDFIGAALPEVPAAGDARLVADAAHAVGEVAAEIRVADGVVDAAHIVGDGIGGGLKFADEAAETAEKVINIGAGDNLLEGAVNVDKRVLEGIDVAADVNALPFAEKTFDKAVSINPHDYSPLTSDVGRTLKEGGTLEVVGQPWNKEIAALAKMAPEEIHALGFELVKGGEAAEEIYKFGIPKRTDGIPISPVPFVQYTFERIAVEWDMINNTFKINPLIP